MYNELNRLDHDGKIFSSSNWPTVKMIVNNKILSSFSPVLSLDLTEKCNYNCAFCVDKGIVRKNQSKELDWMKLQKLLREIVNRGCHAIEITGGGEPTMYSKFSEFIAFASQLGYRLGMITNGSKLFENASAINNSNFDWVRISLNSACDSTHAFFHNVNQSLFSYVIKGIEKISSKTPTGISFIVDDNNYKEIYDCIKLAENIGVKYCEFKPKLQNNKFINYENLVDGIREQLNKAQGSRVKVILTKSFKEILECTPCTPKTCNICFASYFRTLLTPSGVYTCPYLRGSNYRVNCDLNADSIIEARNSLIKSVDPVELCSNYCARYNINTLIESIKIIADNHPDIYKYLGWPIDIGEDVIWL